MSDAPPPYPDGTEPTFIPAQPAGAPTPLPVYPTIRSAYPDPAPPATWGAAAAYQMPYVDPNWLSNDPLVTHIVQGFGGWWQRVWKTFARSWRSLLPIIALTSGLPALVFVLTTMNQRNRWATLMAAPTPQESQAQLDAHLHALLSVELKILGLVLILGVVTAFTSGIGWSAAIWTITKHAVGEPAPFGSAMTFGARKCLRLAGWFLLYGLIVCIGLVCCILPGLYFAVAGGLIAPIVIFRRETAIGESFRLVNRNFGAALGRLAALVGLTAGVSVAVGVVRLALPSDGLGGVISGVVGVAAALPMSIVLIIGVMLTYVELQAREQPLNSAGLNSAL
jgi:hypothetical protein